LDQKTKLTFNPVFLNLSSAMDTYKILTKLWTTWQEKHCTHIETSFNQRSRSLHTKRKRSNISWTAPKVTSNEQPTKLLYSTRAKTL